MGVKTMDKDIDKDETIQDQREKALRLCMFVESHIRTVDEEDLDHIVEVLTDLLPVE